MMVTPYSGSFEMNGFGSMFDCTHAQYRNGGQRRMTLTAPQLCVLTFSM
jgi:hypothetical protein